MQQPLVSLRLARRLASWACSLIAKKPRAARRGCGKVTRWRSVVFKREAGGSCASRGSTWRAGGTRAAAFSRRGKRSGGSPTSSLPSKKDTIGSSLLSLLPSRDGTWKLRALIRVYLVQLASRPRSFGTPRNTGNCSRQSSYKRRKLGGETEPPAVLSPFPCAHRGRLGKPPLASWLKKPKSLLRRGGFFRRCFPAGGLHRRLTRLSNCTDFWGGG